MNDRMFDSPVFVKDGTSLIQEVACLEDALEFLYDWPKHRRGLTYRTALQACQSAFEGTSAIRAAKQAFSSFAKSCHILEDVSVPLPWRTGSTRGRDANVPA